MTKLDPRWSFLMLPLLAALGCSDPVPLPNQGAIDLSLHTSATHVNGQDCPVSGKTYDIGDALGTTTQDRTPVTVINGANGATVSCSVHGGGPFTFSGSIHGNTPDGSTVDLNLTNGQVGADKSTGTVDVSLYTQDTLARLSSTGGSCTVTTVGMNIKGGSIWAKVSCPAVSAPPSYQCGIDATVVFEDCDGS